MFFKTDAAPGSNVFGCVATDVWQLQSGGSGGGETTADFQGQVEVAANRLTVSCPTGKCNVQEGDAITAFGGLNASFIPVSGTYTAYVYLEGGTLRYGHANGTMKTCGGACVPGITSFPANAVPLYTAAVLNGAFQTGSFLDQRSRYRAPKRAITGANLVIAETSESIMYSMSSSAALRNQPVGAQPACSAANRGTFWHVNGAAGVKDTVAVCAKDQFNAYAWRTIY
jgi:hypothetical protein